MAETLAQQVGALATRVGQECKEIKEDIGDTTALQTNDKTSVVGAINEIKETLGTGAAEDITYDGYGYESVKEALDDLLYEPINLTSFTNSVNTVEMGTTISEVTLNWDYNKVPTSLTLDGEAVETPTAKTKTLSELSLTTDKTYTLIAKDERNASSTKTTKVSFLNGVYWGVGASIEAGAADSAFILGMQKQLSGSKAKTFTVNAGANQHIYYAVPKRLGTVSFNVGGFDGGFSLLTEVSFQNASGYTEDYYVYKSDNANLGNTTVTCK